MNGLGILLVGGGIGIIALLLLRYYLKFTRGITAIEAKLAKNGFTISRKIGRFDVLTGGTSFYLYVDDVNKKWVMTSPMDGAVDRIRRFDEFEAVDFYDYDDNSWIKKMGDTARKTDKVVGAVIGGAIGGGLGLALGWAVPVRALGSAWTGILAGTAGAKGGANLGAKVLPLLDIGTKNISGSYGLIMKTTDSEDNALVFDFLTMAAKVVFSNAPRLARNSRIYKNDMKAIVEIGKVFDQIYASSH